MAVEILAILTMAAGEPMARLHDRQPVILDPEVYDAWLDPDRPADHAKKLLARNLDGELQFHRVSRAVNSTKDRTDFAAMIEPGKLNGDGSPTISTSSASSANWTALRWRPTARPMAAGWKPRRS